MFFFYPMEKLELNPRIISVLKKARLWCLSAILELSESDLERRTQLSLLEINYLKKTVAQHATKGSFVTAKCILTMESSKKPKQSRISLGCSTLDAKLQGGFLFQGITEITGASSCGKTQLCLQICLTIQETFQMDRINAGAVYICTEDPFPSKRLMQMIVERKKDHLWQCLKLRLPELLEQGKVRLVIIDSVAALFRCDDSSVIQKVDRLCSLAAHLHTLGLQYHVGFICVNQVTAAIGSTNLSKQNIPALGLAWAHFITCRILLSRTNQIHSTCIYNNKTVPIVLRNLQVLLAPHLPQVSVPFIINTLGVQGIS